MNLNNLSKQQKTVLVVISSITLLLILTLTIIIASFSDRRPSNVKKIQATIDKTASTKDLGIKVNRVIYDVKGWDLAELSQKDDPTNISYIIYHDGKIVLGPGTDFGVSALYNNNVPQDIIDKLYPNKPHWVNFESSYDKVFSMYDYKIRTVIKAFAQQKTLSINKISMIGESKYNVENPRGNNPKEVRSLSFKINDDNTTYNLTCTYQYPVLNQKCIISDVNHGELMQTTLAL